MTDLSIVEKVKKLALIAMFSDDTLMDMLVLKGGNAIKIVYNLSGRGSIDLDFSMQTEFEKEELDTIEEIIKKVLKETFFAEALTVFDINFSERPEKMSAELKTFWGGYKIEFKVMPNEVYEKHSESIEMLRRQAAVVGPKQRKIFKIDISKFEYCKGKGKKDVEGYTVYVYTPEMMILEKLRAVCQQMSEYRKIIPTQTRTPRARDFFDIYTLMKAFPINLNSEENKELLKIIFEAKKVPISFLEKIANEKTFHEQDFMSLRDTVDADFVLGSFDFYFDYVVDEVSKISF